MPKSQIEIYEYKQNSAALSFNFKVGDSAGKADFLALLKQAVADLEEELK